MRFTVYALVLITSRGLSNNNKKRYGAPRAPHICLRTMQNEKDLEIGLQKEKTESVESAKAEKIADKKRKLKKISKIALISIGGLLLAAVLAYVALYWVIPLLNNSGYEDWQFFEPDYDKNIFEDEVYMNMRRGIKYKRGGSEIVLSEENVDEQHVTARFFYDYLNCIIEGDYESYPNFYTERCKNDRNFNCPEKFTMQALYDIRVALEFEPEVNDGVVTEIYTVEYRIYQNNGTYRRDILPDETRRRVFEVVIDGEDVKINSITYQETIKDESE